MIVESTATNHPLAYTDADNALPLITTCSFDHLGCRAHQLLCSYNGRCQHDLPRGEEASLLGILPLEAEHARVYLNCSEGMREWYCARQHIMILMMLPTCTLVPQPQTECTVPQSAPSVTDLGQEEEVNSIRVWLRP